VPTEISEVEADVVAEGWVLDAGVAVKASVSAAMTLE